MSFRYQVSAPGLRATHSHPHIKLAAIFDPAAGVFTTWNNAGESRKLILTGRQLYCVGSNIPHAAHWESDAAWIEALLHDALLESIPANQISAVLARESIEGAAHDPVLWELATKVRLLCSQPEQPNMRILEPMMVAFVRRVFACHSECFAPKPGSRLSDDRTQLVTDHMEENLSQRIEAATLAALVNLSPQHFTELFRSRTGRPPIEYLRELRRIRAHDLIFSGELRMGEIADACGFCDEPHLNREFKKFFGYPAKLLRSRGKSVTDSGIPVASS